MNDSFPKSTLHDNSRFGWPLPRRKEELTRAQVASKATYRVQFQGRVQDIPIVRVPIDLPKYRIANGRTVSSQQEYLAKHPDKPADFFERDPELLEVQEVQHELLKQLVNEVQLFDYFKNPSQQQTDPLILDENGFVVNGNRRLTAWRMLFQSDATQYSHFAYVDVVVLPHCDEREIDRLEARLQIERDIRADYTWDAEANMIRQKMLHHSFTTNEVASLYGKTESEINLLLQMHDCAVEYLRSRGRENQWSLVSQAKFAFDKLVKNAAKTNDVGEKTLITNISYSLIDSPAENLLFVDR